MDIIPAILSSSPDEARALLRLCDQYSPRTQIDILDQVFADNRTVPPEIFEDEYLKTKIDFHLMVKDPEKWILRCARGGGDRVIGQIEQMTDQGQFVRQVVEQNMEAGLAIDLQSKVESISEDILPILAVVLVMGVKAGFGGQEFDHQSAIPKIEKLRETRGLIHASFRICVDGGVNLSNINDIKSAGADEVAIGRRILNDELEENIERFKRTIVS